MIIFFVLVAQLFQAHAQSVVPIRIKMKIEKFAQVKNFFSENFWEGESRGDLTLEVNAVEIDETNAVRVNLTKPFRPGNFPSYYFFKTVKIYNSKVSDESLKLNLTLLQRIRSRNPQLNVLNLEALGRLSRLRLINFISDSHDNRVREKNADLSLNMTKTQKPVFDSLLPDNPLAASSYQLLRLNLFNLGFVTDSTVASLPRPPTDAEIKILGPIPDGTEAFVTRIGNAGLFFVVAQSSYKKLATPSGSVILLSPKPLYFKSITHPTRMLSCEQLLIRALQ